MMLLSRFWYAILAVLAGFAVYSLMLSVGEYNRRSTVATDESLASDTQVVRWALQIDSRHRLDALLIGSVDKGVQDALVATIDKDKIPAKAKADAAKALVAISQKLPPEYKEDALFAVDRNGRVVAQVGYDKANAFEDFELGGYTAVNDALHGYLRDDTWVWGGEIYRVVARPVEYDVTQPPAGAIIGLKAVDRTFAQDIAKLTRTNIAFYSQGQRVASAGQDGFDESQFDLVTTELPKLGADTAYKDKGRTEIRPLGKGVLDGIFTKLDGDAFELGSGFAVVRPRVTLGGPLAVLSSADDTDKKGVNLGLVIGIVVFGLIVGVGLTLLEHDRPMRGMAKQAKRLVKGEVDLLPLPLFRAGYRDIATDINAGIERVAEKGGGAPRKTADLEAIVGPVSAQPAMSAFAFPLAGGDGGQGPVMPPPPGPPRSAPQAGGSPASGPKPPPPRPAPSPGPAAAPVAPNPAPPSPLASLQQPPTSPTVVAPMQIPQQPNGPPRAAPSRPGGMPAAPGSGHEEEEATMVASVPQEVLARAAGADNPDEAEWPIVYEEFIKTKKQCNEPTEGLTFEKFRQTLKKNRDALVQRHNCKRVKFTVYVKDGRASLKATPVKD